MTPRPTLDRLRSGRASAREVALLLLGPLVLALVVLAVIGNTPIVQRANLATPLEAPGRVVVLGAPGLAWADVTAEDTPGLWTVFGQGSSAALTVRSVHERTCPVDGWLSLSAGERAAEAGSSPQTCVPAPDPRPVGDTAAPGGPVQLPGWPRWVAAAADRPLDAEPGLLGHALQARDICVHAYGPGAAIAAADRQGRVPRYTGTGDTAGTWDTDAEDTDGDNTAGSRALQDDCAVQFVDVGAVRDHSPDDAEANEADRARQVEALDSRVQQVLDRTSPEDLVIVSGLADSGQTPHLRLLALDGPGVEPGTLVSSSTRQPGLVQLSDVTATILDLHQIDIPDAVSGTSLRTIDDTSVTRTEDPVPAPDAAEERLQQRLDTGDAAHEVHPLPAPFFVTWGLAQIAAYAWGIRRLRRAHENRDAAERSGALRWLATSATVAAAVPAAAFLANLVPWWRAPVPYLAVLGVATAFTVVLVTVARAGPWRHTLLGPIAAVMALTMVVLAADVMTGSSLQTSSLMGLQPVVAGRFYGMGNVTFGLFATATLILATCLAGPLYALGQRRLAAWAVAVPGTAAVLVDGLPAWGADFGGPPALVPAVAYLVLAALQVRLTWRRVAAILLLTVTVLGAMAVLDWMRPRSSRTHLGNFVQSVLDGEAPDIIGRKLEQNVAILVSTPLTILVPVLLAVAIWAVARPDSRPGRRLATVTDRVPLLRAGLIAILICWVIGFALNDSGTGIPAVGATVLLPAVIVMAARTAESRSEVPGPSRIDVSGT